MPAADRFSALIESTSLRLARSPLPAWLGEAASVLRSLLPPRLRAMLEGDEQRLYLLRRGDDVELLAAGRHGDVVLGQLPLGDDHLLAGARQRADQSAAGRWLLLPSSAVLRRVLPLPAAAEPRLREVLAFELDRQTPFTADQVTYQGRVLSRDLASQQLQVELWVLPRARLAAEMQALGPLGEHLAGVDAVDPDGLRHGLNLLPETGQVRRMDPARKLNAALAAIAVICVLGALAMTLHNRGARLEQFKRDVAAANDAARQARIVRNQLETSAAAANFLAEQRALRPTMLEVLDDLTRRIPDDTALDKLAINDGKLVIVGQSRGAPALVGLLQDSPLLREPALSGAVQADPRTGRDRFTLTALIGPAPSAPAPPSAPTGSVPVPAPESLR